MLWLIAGHPGLQSAVTESGGKRRSERAYAETSCWFSETGPACSLSKSETPAGGMPGLLRLATCPGEGHRQPYRKQTYRELLRNYHDRTHLPLLGLRGRIGDDSGSDARAKALFGARLPRMGWSTLAMSSRPGRLPVIPHRKCPLLPRASKILLSNATPILRIQKDCTSVRGLRPKSCPFVIRLEFAIPISFGYRFLPVFHSSFS
jgi:hypothetical protein